jgi:hypothetical protein
MNAKQVERHGLLGRRISHALRQLPRIGRQGVSVDMDGDLATTDGRDVRMDDDEATTYGQVAALLASIVQACAEIVQNCAGVCSKINDMPAHIPASEFEVALVWRDVADRAMSMFQERIMEWDTSNKLQEIAESIYLTDEEEQIYFYAELAEIVASRAMQLEVPGEPQDSIPVVDVDECRACGPWPDYRGAMKSRAAWFAIYDHVQSMAERTEMLLRHHGVNKLQLPQLPKCLREQLRQEALQTTPTTQT